MTPGSRLLEFGRLLNDLGHGPCPAITGIIDGPFDLPLHDVEERRQAYMAHPLGLSAFGLALLRGEDDIVRHAPRCFWWGATLVTRQRPWRWSAQDDVLSR